jgi:hypothetical protein
VIPGPTPSNQLAYCCPCGQGSESTPTKADGPLPDTAAVPGDAVDAQSDGPVPEDA